jgi:uncharacterized protein YhjY with autotransporter beta-barrel domain
MQERRIAVSRHSERSEFGWWLAGIRQAAAGVAAAVGLSAALVLALAEPAAAGSPPAPTFCNQTQSGCIPQAGPVSNPSAGISGSTQRQIEQRLQQLRCEGSDDPACAGSGGAAADAVSFEGLGVFVSAGYEFKDKEVTDTELGFTSDSIGPTVGVDYRLTDNAVIGGAFSWQHAFGDYDDGYGDFDTDTFTFLVFGSYYPTDQSFIDAAVGFAPKQFDNEHLDPGGGGTNIRGDTNGFDFTADLTGGYDFSFGAFTVGPRLGIHYKRTELNSFTETGVGNLVAYDDQVDDSLTGTVGLQASYAISTSFGVIVPQASAEYVREFLDDRETFTATDAGGTFDYVGDQPDRNHFNVGGGVVILLPNGIFPFINYEAELANYLQETHTVTGGVRLEF